MLSASHNPYADNGIKLFGPDGYKLSDEIETAIELSVEMDNGDGRAAPAQLGRAQRLDDAPGRYVEFVKNTLPRGLRLDGLRVVIDCAHGAAYKVAPAVLYELGADIIKIGVSPNGFNINRECGAVSTAAMQETVVREGAHIGLALDGDADRLLVADQTGKLLDGDQLMALIATNWQRSGRLLGGGVVATVMSNLGLERYLDGIGLNMVRTAVGDRYVVEHMRRHGFNLGGEQSGHIILSDHSTTGDGLIAALQILAALVESGRTASETARIFTPMPQFLKSTRVPKGIDVLAEPRVIAAVADAEKRLTASGGRLLVRKSGTEPVVRVMAEGEKLDAVKTIVEELTRVVQTAGRDLDEDGARPAA
jgi:phosphoglucosamine mutase